MRAYSPLSPINESAAPLQVKHTCYAWMNEPMNEDRKSKDILYSIKCDTVHQYIISDV